jgi:plasmid stabilization system protein ParE
MTAAAEKSLYDAALWWAEHRDAAQAIQWLERFEAAIQSLCQNPLRYAQALESPLFPFELRQLLFGVGKRKTHRALFEVRENNVIVHCVLHLHQQDVKPKDLGLRGL